MMTFLAPPLTCAEALSTVVNTPVDSIMYSAPILPHGMAAGSYRTSRQHCGQRRDSRKKTHFLTKDSNLVTVDNKLVTLVGNVALETTVDG